ncbi:hypothetical protein F2Q69_00063222 [Brassica cretica]|uniref:Protein kinase domain-containing protein n=1 Tax=Brassica cretica TaxID=69181 RepID=A0A8S9RAI6_BRACR|nr:hypothetical protein F2Q69_00063222 [Brassica cretica]
MAMKPNGKSPITSEDLSRRYFHQLISAVGYCHSRGVFHRDLKFHVILGSPGFNISGMFSGEYDRVERFVSMAARVLQHRSYRLLDSCNESFFRPSLLPPPASILSLINRTIMDWVSSFRHENYEESSNCMKLLLSLSSLALFRDFSIYSPHSISNVV